MRFCWLLLLCGCTPIESGKYAPDPGSYPSEDADSDGGIEDTGTFTDVDDCEDVPLVNWNNFGEGFFIQNCDGCHHSETPNRYGAPESIVFDTAEDVWSRRAIVLHAAGGDDPSMPPQGGSTVLQREKLEIWLNCGEEGT